MSHKRTIPRSKGSFILLFPNGRKRRYRYQENVDAVTDLVSRGRFNGVADMWQQVCALPNGY